MLPSCLVASGSKDKNIRIWNVTSGKSRVLDHDKQVKALVSLSNGLLASGDSGGYITLWDLTSFSSVRSWKAHSDGGVRSLAFDCGKKMLLSGGDDRLVKMWDSRMWDSFEKYAKSSCPWSSRCSISRLGLDFYLCFI